MKPSLDEKPSKSLLPSPLKPPRPNVNFPQHSVMPPHLAHPPSIPSGFCRAVGGPTAPKHRPSPSSSTYQEHLVPTASSASPVILLGKICKETGFGQPLFDMHYSHTGSDGFLYFTYKVFIPGITMAFKGVVMILPGPNACTVLEEAQRAAAQQVLQRVYNNQLVH